MPFFGVKPPPLLCSRRPHRTFIPLSPSCRAILQVETRSYCVHGAQCPSLASSRRRCCALAVHTGRLYRSRHRAGRLFKSRRALLRSRCSYPSLASSRRRCCALAVHIGRLYRSRHRAGRLFKSRRALIAFTVLDPFFGVRPPPLLCSRRPHWTFIPLSPSCRAIIQVETRSYCVHGARCPSLASSRRRCCALAVHIGR